MRFWMYVFWSMIVALWFDIRSLFVAPWRYLNIYEQKRMAAGIG